MKICILSSFDDSMKKETGGSVRIYNLAKGLVANGHEVKVVMPNFYTKRDFLEGVEVYHLKGFFPEALLKILQRVVNIGRPTSLYFYDLFFVHRVRQILSDSDVVQIEQQSSGALLAPFIKKILKKPVVIDCHDVFQALRIQKNSLVRKILETFSEKIVYRNASLVLTVSDDEKKILSSMKIDNCPIKIVPNGVDTTFFTKSLDSNNMRKKYGVSDFQVVVFVGNLAYPPNWEATQLLSSVIAPKVMEKNKNVRFLVVGKIKDTIKLPGLTFTGFVESVSEILSISDIGVAPLFQGSGTRLKILEYFSSSLPVVSTSIGAEGLEVKNGINIFLEDDLDLFSNRIVELLENNRLSRDIGENARVLATTKYDWKKITKELGLNYYKMFFH